ncbi:RNA 2',3'-cyclic phosphodiesterase [archaeon]|nr:RNA 2',3'-cyclic phosphodiesterase [archaeon]
MRCFIGIPLPGRVRKALVKAQDGFRHVDARMRLVKEPNLHITLHFLGGVDNVDKVDESLREVSFSSFKASLKNLSFFPKKSYIRVIHSPVKNGRQQVIELYDKVAEALSLDPEDRFTPHATLARVKFVKSTNALARACYDVRFEESFTVKSFNLYNSDLTPKGPVYEVISTYTPKDLKK